MKGAKSSSTPRSSTCIIMSNDNSKYVNESGYRGMIDFLLYLTVSRPDILFNFYKCTRFQSAPKESHLTAVKRIIRYLIGTISLGLLYPKTNDFKLKKISYGDYASDKNDRKSTSDTCQLMKNSLKSLKRKKNLCFSIN